VDRALLGTLDRALLGVLHCARTLRVAGWVARFETSAKDNINIDKACRTLVAKILENDVSTVKEPAAGSVDPAAETAKPAGGCCGS
jgi:hypothetical protein